MIMTCFILAMTGFMDLILTINSCDCQNFYCYSCLFKGYHNEQISEELERSKRLNSVDFYNFDSNFLILILIIICILISFVLNTLMSSGNKRPQVFKQTGQLLAKGSFKHK